MSRLVLKSPAEIAIMHEANLIIRRIIDELRERIRPGITTADIDAFAERRILEAGARPAFKGYPHRGDGRDFPATVCASVNDEVIHGVPSKNRRLENRRLKNSKRDMHNSADHGGACNLHGRCAGVNSGRNGPGQAWNHGPGPFPFPV